MAADGTPLMADVLEALAAVERGEVEDLGSFSEYLDDGEEIPMTMPTDPDAQNPDDTSGGADAAAGLQGDIAADSDDN